MYIWVLDIFPTFMNLIWCFYIFSSMFKWYAREQLQVEKEPILGREKKTCRRSYMLWHIKATPRSARWRVTDKYYPFLFVPAWLSLIGSVMKVGQWQRLDERLDKPVLQQYNWCRLFSPTPPPQVSTCASVLRDTPAARWRWRRT